MTIVLFQAFIFLTVTTFGPLACSIATTTRKFFTILASVIFFGHSLLTRQWLGTVCVFVGLGLDTLYGKELKPAHTTTAKTSGTGDQQYTKAKGRDQHSHQS